MMDALTDGWWLYITSVFVSFTSVFLKGFQHKNVIGSHMKATFITSYAMSAFDVAAVSLIVKGGWPIAFTSGTGAAFGMIAAMLVHDKMFKKTEV